MPIILESSIYEIHKFAEVNNESGQIIPIPSFRVSDLSEFALVINSSSDRDTESFSAGKVTITYPAENGEVLGEEFLLILGEYQAIKVAAISDTFSLDVSINFWIEDVRLKIWKGEEVLPQYPIFPVSNSRNSIPQTPTTTPASATAVQIAAARSGRNRLSIYNNSNGNMYVRYAPTGTETNATTAAGGFDEIIAAGNVFEYPGNDYPESAINAIWSVAAGVTLSGNCTVSEGVRG